VVALALAFPAPVNAQDTRKVVEPIIPPACATLTAQIGRAGMSIAPADETKLDTVRIQKAIEQCTPVHSVVLKRASSRRDAFLTGPLRLAKGVVLVVDRGTYLYASRNARDYDLSIGSCGTVTEQGYACKGLINGEGVSDSGSWAKASLMDAAAKPSLAKRPLGGISLIWLAKVAARTIRTWWFWITATISFSTASRS
jgi:polygalacturonase